MDKSPKNKNSFIMPLALMVFGAVAFSFFVYLTVNNPWRKTKEECLIVGCHQERCVSSNEYFCSSCTWQPEFDCYQSSECKIQTNGKCGWTNTEKLRKCLYRNTEAFKKSNINVNVNRPKGCLITGCSNELCVEEGTFWVTTCEVRAESKCYEDAVCERQTDGKCGWTMADKLKNCLSQYQ